MISERQVKMYCYEIEKIENYDLAITDMEHTWDCHHRLEIGKNGENISYNDLKKHGLYYNRPASELIFLTKSEHTKLHNSSGRYSEETRKKISEAKMGKHRSEETRKKIRESVKAYWEKKKAGI